VRSAADPGRVASVAPALHTGETQAIALACETTGSLLLIDEKAGRAVAAQLGVNTIGVAGILLNAKAANLVPAVKPLLDRLRREFRFFIADGFYAQVISAAGE
jgi:predicted nucleic acid-binding protein